MLSGSMCPLLGFGGGREGVRAVLGLGHLVGRVFRAGSPPGALSCHAGSSLPRSFPYPHSSLLNCVIIFKQINSIAEFFLS